MSYLLDALTDTLTPHRWKSSMHTMAQMSCMIDRTLHSLSERSLLSIYSRRGETDRTPGQHMVTFWMPPQQPPKWVMS